MKKIAVIAGSLFILVGGVWLALPSPADADSDIRRSSANAVVTHGDWRYNNPATGGDGGFEFTVCGSTINAFDGGVGLVENPCIECQPGAWSGAPAACLAAWKAANNL